MANTNVRGRFVWHELLTPNCDGAHEFYERAVGWRRQAYDQDASYSMFVGPRGPLGGAVEDRTGTPQWLPYVATTDVDATVETATGLGARVQTAPTSLPNAGRYAVLLDPQGAAFGVHASAAARTPESAPEPGEFSWHELATSVAPEEAFAFYTKLFGWDELSRFDMGPMGTYLIFGRNGVQLGGMFDKGAAGRPGAAYWLGYISVADLEAAAERAKDARASVLVGPMDVPGGDRIAQLMDPHGAFFALHMRAAGAQAASAQQPRAQAGGASAPGKAQRQPTKKAAAPKRRAKTAARKPAKKPAAKKARKKAGAARPRKAAKAARKKAPKRAAAKRGKKAATKKKKRR
jgi:predicted enzyme related to lactoylglutathione lyase